MDNVDLSALRKEYKQFALNENDVDRDPIAQFDRWWRQAEKVVVEEPNSMTLSTVGLDGEADARIVLMKSFGPQGFVFFTNYQSTKSQQIKANPNVCLLFFWKELERQVRIYGQAIELSTQESIQYFDSRPEGSKIGAWASPQSMIIAGQAWLKETFHFYQERFKHGKIPKPPHWGGYQVAPSRIEFWQGRPNRLHDRIRYVLSDNVWRIERLAP